MGVKTRIVTQRSKEQAKHRNQTTNPTVIEA